MGRIIVTLGEYSHPVTIVAGLFNEPASPLPLKSGDQVISATNGTLAPLYLDKVRGAFERAGVNVDNTILPDGERCKNLTVLDMVFTALPQEPYGRDTTSVTPGGGVIGDLTSFTAASYQRGVRFIQVPITLLSQADSSADGKTAVNHPLGKNMIGVSYQPASVAVDPDCLKMLPARELALGLMEVIKYGIILDGGFFSWLEDSLDVLPRLDDPAMAYCIRRRCELKAEVVAADECEMGLRALLNLGYTFDHAIETEVGYDNWLHGEAVAAGMVMVICTSERLGQLTSADTQCITMPLQRADLLVNGPREMSTEAYLPYMLRDKKVLAGEIRSVLPRAIGKSEVCGGVSYEVVLNAIADCQQVQ